MDCRRVEVTAEAVQPQSDKEAAQDTLIAVAHVCAGNGILQENGHCYRGDQPSHWANVRLQ
jgi:hypothetical protein